jgi:hypothetical protein
MTRKGMWASVDVQLAVSADYVTMVSALVTVRRPVPATPPTAPLCIFLPVLGMDRVPAHGCEFNAESFSCATVHGPRRHGCVGCLGFNGKGSERAICCPWF